MIYLYGSAHPGNTRTIRVTPGSRRIEIPVITGFIDLSNFAAIPAPARIISTPV